MSGGGGSRKSAGSGRKTPASSASLSETPGGPAGSGKSAGQTTNRRPPKATALKARGQRLWDDLVDDVVGERGRVLLEEACRITDRLDALARILAGQLDELLVAAIRQDVVDLDELLVAGDHHIPFRLVVDAALVESRQQAAVLRQLMVALPLKPEEPEEPEGDDDDDFGGWPPT